MKLEPIQGVNAGYVLELYERYRQNPDSVDPATREAMLEILHAQEFNSMIPERLPKGARVAHKTGEISTVCHDAGIVFLPERKPYVVAILTSMPVSVETRTGPVAEISRVICEALETP